MYDYEEIPKANRKPYFRLDNKFVDNLILPEVGKFGIIMYVSIGIHCNKGRPAICAYPKLSEISGYTESHIENNIGQFFDKHSKILEIKRTSFQTNRGKYSFKYFLVLPPTEEDEYFYTKIYAVPFRGGNIAACKPSSRVAYLVMSRFSKMDYELYRKIENLRPCHDKFMERESQIRWKYCLTPKSIIAKHAGISARHMNVVLADLESHYLIESFDTGDNIGWRVYHHPKKVYVKFWGGNNQGAEEKNIKL